MEASSAVRRCASHMSHSSKSYRHCAIRTRSILTSKHRTCISRTSSRPFASTTSAHQETSPRTQSASQSRSPGQAGEAILAKPSSNTKSSPNSESSGRIDLSSLPGIPPSYKPPANNDRPNTSSRPGPSSASAKLDALFGKTTRSTSSSSSGDNPFERTLRQTANRSVPKFDVASLLEDLSVSKTRPFDSSDYNAADHKLPLRLAPTLGRTQTIDNVRNMDLTRAFRMLESRCSQNNVKRDTIAQKFHVRRGQKRKLLRSSRWRVAFRKGFLEECARVRRMKNQGW